MDNSSIDILVEVNLNTLLTEFKENPALMAQSVTEMAKRSEIRDIILLRAMLRDIEYTLKTVYDTDDRRIHQYSFIICKIFDTNMDKLRSKDKTNDLPVARQLLTYYLTKIHIPRNKIIELLNYSDPSTVIYNLNKINGLMDTGDTKIMSLLNAVNTQIYLNPTLNG